MAAVAGRVPVVVGASDLTTANTIRRAEHAQRAGADALMIGDSANDADAARDALTGEMWAPILQAAAERGHARSAGERRDQGSGL